VKSISATLWLHKAIGTLPLVGSNELALHTFETQGTEAKAIIMGLLLGAHGSKEEMTPKCLLADRAVVWSNVQ
jgi:hypothetical protein